MTTRYRSLPVDAWPIRDRMAWEDARRPALRLRAGGRASYLKPATQKSLERGYGMFLDCCRRMGHLDHDAEAASHVSPSRIEEFLDELRTRVGSVTRTSYIRRVQRMAEILAPSSDLLWLREIGNDLKAEERPRPKHHRIVDSDRLLALGLDLIARGKSSTDRTELQRARLIRDGLMVALLALCPIRLKNLASLRIGQQLQRIEGTWWIVLGPDETKTGRPDERAVPSVLTAAIDDWIRSWRNLFLDPCDVMWPSTKGGALAYTYVGTIITETTRRELGAPINPHLFRDCAVHTVAVHAGNEMGIASGLLQHTDPRTTEKHYAKGSNFTAATRYQAILMDYAEER